MGGEIDLNKLTAELVQSNLENSFSYLSARLQGAKNIVRSKLDRTYRNYLQRILERYSRGKSFFVRSEPIPLYDFFVPLDLASDRRYLTAPSARKLTASNPHCIITGLGGSGKTMMMRHMLISTIADKNKTPIFLELRQLNSDADKLRSVLLKTLQVYGLEIDDDYFEIALRAGHFCILLDGFDELQQTRRKTIASEIREISEQYPQNWIVVSSRPERALAGWSPFVEFGVRPLKLEQAVQLIEKLPFDDVIKSKFIGDLRANLFNEHESFLSNPLLLSIMLLTYRDVAHIPTKLSVFYSQAYESLFHKHDALKGGFQRERQSGLDIQDFGRVFSAFCLQTYDKRQFAFTYSTALDTLQRSKSITHLSFDPESFLADALQAVCLLLEDGPEITFAHRSFQEYFTARFIASSSPLIKPKLVNRLSKTASSDAVVSLLYDIDPDSVEVYYLLPAIGELKRRIKLVRRVGVTHHLRYLKYIWKTLECQYDRSERDSPNLGGTLSNSILFSALVFGWRIHKSLGNPEPADNDDLLIQLINEAGSYEGDGTSAVSTQNITAGSPLARALFESYGIWGKHFLETLLIIEADILRRQAETRESLETILA